MARENLPLRLVGIGSSAGGPAAVAAVLQGLKKSTPVSVVLVQHLLSGFAAPFAQFLRDQTTLAVHVVDAPVEPMAGVVYVPPDDRHVVASATGLHTSNAPPKDGHRPSVNTLFSSLADVYGSSAMGVILSGMGDDGVIGLKAMRARGSVTVAQSQESCAVYGMPRVAIESGAASVALAPTEIAEAINETIRRGSVR